MSWLRAFDVPIVPPDGRELHTLCVAGKFIIWRPQAEQNKPHWQFAAHELMMAAARGGIVMMGVIAMRQALFHGKPNPVPAPKKKTTKHLPHRPLNKLKAALHLCKGGRVIVEGFG